VERPPIRCLTVEWDDAAGGLVYPSAMDAVETLPIEPDLPADPPDAYVEALVRRAGSSFFWGMRRLTPERRRGVYAVYGFCREVDDIADGDFDLSRKVALLDLWRTEVARLYAGEPRHPIGLALLPAVRNYGLNQADFVAVVDGMAMDAAPRVRITDRAELSLYCDRVACAVGRLCNPIFGIPSEVDNALAAALGEAMQLTNILRDIVEDAGRDRVYLPADALRAVGANGDGIEDILTAPGLAELCGALASEASAKFEAAGALIATVEKSAARPVVMMLKVYKNILENLMRRGWDNLEQNVGPGRLGKLMIAARYGIFG